MGGWGCPHEVRGRCMKINELPCDPGMKGCVLFGRVASDDDSKQRPAQRRVQVAGDDKERAKTEEP